MTTGEHVHPVTVLRCPQFVPGCQSSLELSRGGSLFSISACRRSTDRVGGRPADGCERVGTKSSSTRALRALSGSSERLLETIWLIETSAKRSKLLSARQNRTKLRVCTSIAALVLQNVAIWEIRWEGSDYTQSVTVGTEDYMKVAPAHRASNSYGVHIVHP
jgi:hypothetical protein